MISNRASQDKFLELRSQAEKLLAAKGKNKDSAFDDDPIRLINELQTYQIELKLQNEELHRSQQELYRSQQELLESKNCYTQLYDLSPVGYATLSSKGLLLNANLTLADMLLMERSQLINQPMSAYIVPEDQDIYYQYKKSLKDTIPQRFSELRMKKKDESIIDVRLESTLASDNSGEIIEYRIAVSDITEFKYAQSERKKLQIRLAQAQKREAIGTLAGGIAHDFNNILSGIFGFSQLIGTHINHPETVRKYNKRIFEGAQRASNLIGQILSFSRRVEYSRRPLEFLTILKEALKLIRSTIPSNIQIKKVLKTKGVILADPTQIHQVIMNLCTNAYHAMDDDGGTITILLDEVLLSEDQIPRGKNLFPGKFLKLEVRDTGSGIDHQIKEKIFDPYFTTKETGKGSGLGLAVVEGIVKKHNGFIKFDSTIGQGSVFYIHFPVIENVRNERKDPERKEKKISKTFGSVMLVDDESAILDTLKAILSEEGYEIRTFDNGESALQAFAETPVEFDLIITDMAMPKMTGDKLSREILKIRADIPIIICTGYHENFTEKEAIKLGIKKYIQKPVAGSELSKIIRELLDPIPT